MVAKEAVRHPILPDLDREMICDCYSMDDILDAFPEYSDTLTADVQHLLDLGLLTGCPNHPGRYCGTDEGVELANEAARGF